MKTLNPLFEILKTESSETSELAREICLLCRIDFTRNATRSFYDLLNLAADKMRETKDSDVAKNSILNRKYCDFESTLMRDICDVLCEGIFFEFSAKTGLSVLTIIRSYLRKRNLMGITETKIRRGRRPKTNNSREFSVFRREAGLFDYP